MSFSQRYGYKKVRESIQKESMDRHLRTRLWNVLYVSYFDSNNDYLLAHDYRLKSLFYEIWDYLNREIDTISEFGKDHIAECRKHFFDCKWFEVYDFIEFIAKISNTHTKNKFIEQCNSILEKEMSAYRFVNGFITPITNKIEIQSIENAVNNNDPVSTHLNRALELLSDKHSPDYRNSIKESISAVESMVTITTGKKGTLRELLKKLETEINLHPALKDAFTKLYGYTSDKNGIRHALTATDDNDFNDAKFMLVTCSAFVNFVIAKIENNRIKKNS